MMAMAGSPIRCAWNPVRSFPRRLLLGWARDREFLIGDYDDADFGYMSEDRELLMDAVETLSRVGFERHFRFRNNDGNITQYVFIRQGIKFDFFEVSREEEIFRLYGYGLHHDQWLQLVCEFSAHGLNTFEFKGRTWMKPDDHELFLDECYGDWRTPNPDFWYLEDDTSVVQRGPWTRYNEMHWE